MSTPNAIQSAPANQQLSASAAKRDFQQLVESDRFKAQITSALPTHLTPDRFIRVLLTATMKNPLLLQCTQESMFKGILDCAAAGLEIDGRRAHLIPYKNNQKRCYEAQLIIDYKGIAELVMRSGVVSAIHADIVCENDEFEYDRGVINRHKIELKKPRGEMYAAYVIVRMKDGGEKADVMSKYDIDAVRSRSRASSSGPWVTDYNEMAKKTVFRRASKWLPLSPEIRSVVDSEADDEPVNVTPKPGLAALIGASDISTQPHAAPQDAAGATVEAEASPVPGDHDNPPADKATAPAETPAPKPAAPAKTFTPEERAAILRNVEERMLTHQVSEAKVMVFVHQNKLAKEGQDEVGTLDTAVLEGLQAVIPTLAAPAKK